LEGKKVAEFTIRPYQVGDFGPVVSLWGRCLKRDPISRETFQVKVLADENFSEQGAFVAEVDGKVVGFLLAIFRKVPLTGVGLQEDTGWITIFFVDSEHRRRKIGTALFDSAENYLKANGRRKVVVSSYVPNYFIPGVDVDAYPEAHEFLQKRGYETVFDQYGMSVDLLDFEPISEYYTILENLLKDGVIVDYFEPKFTHKLLTFLETEFPGDWADVIRGRIRKGVDPRDIVIAKRGDEVVGYCQVDGERFGPFGVHSSLRGKGVGTALITKAMLQAKSKGTRHLWLAWTGAVDFYSQKAGFKVIRTNRIMRKQLEG
jgi:mycothiol synthase